MLIFSLLKYVKENNAFKFEMNQTKQSSNDTPTPTPNRFFHFTLYRTCAIRALYFWVTNIIFNFFQFIHMSYFEENWFVWEKNQSLTVGIKK